MLFTSNFMANVKAACVCTFSCSPSCMLHRHFGKHVSKSCLPSNTNNQVCCICLLLQLKWKARPLAIKLTTTILPLLKYKRQNHCLTLIPVSLRSQLKTERPEHRKTVKLANRYFDKHYVSILCASILLLLGNTITCAERGQPCA